MAMSLLERRKEVEKQQAQNEKKRKADARRRVADRILKGFENPKLINLIEEKLVEDGRLWVTGFGCLCQGGACSDTKGFPMHLKDFEKEWKEKGVLVHYGIPGVHLRIIGAKITKSSVLHIDRKTLNMKYELY